MDQNLRLLRIRKISGDFGESVGEHLDRIAKKLVGPSFSLQPRYFALAHRRENVHDNQIEHWVHADDQLIYDAPVLAGYRYLGRLVSDGVWVYSSWPRYSFRDYVGMEDLPRVAAIPGPHPWDCHCAACKQVSDRIDAARAEYDLKKSVDSVFDDEA